MAFNDNGVIFQSGQPYWDSVLTNYFMQLLPDARNESSVLLGMIEKTGMTAVSGRYLVWPVTFGRNTGVGNVGYRGAIPNPGHRNFATATAITRPAMATIEIDGDTLRHGRTNGGAYADAVRLEMEGVIRDVMIDRARQVHNDGSGRIAEVGTIAGATSSMTVVVNSSIEGASTTRAAGTLDVYFEIGMRVAFITSAGTIRTPYTGKQCAYVQAISVSGSTVTVTFTNTPGGAAVNFDTNPTAGDWIVRCSAEAFTEVKDSSFKGEIMGIGGILSDIGVLNGLTASGTQQSGSFDYTNTATTWFQGVVCSTNPWNQGIVLDSSGTGTRPLTEALMQQALSDAERINNANITMLLSSYQTYDSYVALLTPDKRYQNTTDLKGGHTTLSFNGLPYIKDRFHYQNSISFLALDQVQLAQTKALAALQAEDTGVWNRAYSTTSAGVPLDMYWRGWVQDDELIVKGVRQRCGARLVNLAA